jgi:hypothetical protein
MMVNKREEMKKKDLMDDQWEDLKDKIREVFPDRESQWWRRLGFISLEWGHAYINVWKEEIARYPFIDERVADVLKYIFGIGSLVLLVILLEWGCSGSLL